MVPVTQAVPSEDVLGTVATRERVRSAVRAASLLHTVPPAEFVGRLSVEAWAFIAAHVPLRDPGTCIADSASHLEPGIPAEAAPDAVVKLGRLNDVRWLNKYFNVVNDRLPVGGRFVCYLETLDERRRRFARKYPRGTVTLARVLSFVLHRVFPKLPVTKSVYFALTQGRNRALSGTEALGRLYCCGFEVEETREINNLLYVVARKSGPPQRGATPSYGPLFAMRRVGQGGRLIHVYKLRTMHPYAEYLQKYVSERNGIDGCRVRDDFRVTPWGHRFRRLWIDELPMIINWLRRDLKLVGGRPLSQHHESLYPESLRERRRKYRPGLIPPFYADLPRTFEETIASEIRYLDAYERAPLRTDLRYLVRVLANIVTGRARSN
ncbi:MAG TPA: sugar transferase [Longimicrobium sp.]|nr:sugar transferase [Longimicrobium sp.]